MRKDGVTPRYLNIVQASIYLGMSQKGLRYKLESRQIPFAKIGGSIRLDRLEIDKLLADNAVPPINLGRR